MDFIYLKINDRYCFQLSNFSIYTNRKKNQLYNILYILQVLELSKGINLLSSEKEKGSVHS